MKFWFTADLHFNHENIIKYCNRPFKSIEDMNNKLIKNINSVVNIEDVLIHVGDFMFSYDKCNSEDFINRINCNVILVKGNHDRGNLFKINDLTFNIGKKYCHVIHNPEYAVHEYNIVGHVHSKWKSKFENNKYYVNVGCDVWNYKPISIKRINKEFEELNSNLMEVLKLDSIC